VDKKNKNKKHTNNDLIDYVQVQVIVPGMKNWYFLDASISRQPKKTTTSKLNETEHVMSMSISGSLFTSFICHTNLECCI